MRMVYEKRIMTGCYSFEVLSGLHSADQSTDNIQSAQRREKKQKHQQWHLHRIQFVFVKGFIEQHC
jgi:hypothetical protein